MSHLQEKLKPFALRLKKTYGGSVYLVGSALIKQHPRDIDMRLIMPDEVFEQMFGNPTVWIRQGETGEWTELRWRWSEVCTNETHRLWEETNLPIDFQICPESFFQKYDGLPKLLLA